LLVPYLKMENRHPIFDQMDKFFQNKNGVLGLIIVVVFMVCAAFAPLLAPQNPIENDVSNQMKPPFFIEGGSTKNILGTDDLGRDIFSRLIYGARISITVGVVSVIIAFSFGSFLGALSGYYKGWLDNLIMRIMDMLMAFPSILLAIILVAYMGPNLRNAMIAIGIIRIPSFARIIRASVLEECEKDYVLAAKAIGTDDFRIIFNAVFPNCMAPIIVQASLNFAGAVLDAAGLSFLGLGAQPPTPEWGAMIANGRTLILRAWWVMCFPGIMIFFSVLGFNLLGDGLRDAMDPRQMD